MIRVTPIEMIWTGLPFLQNGQPSFWMTVLLQLCGDGGTVMVEPSGDAESRVSMIRLRGGILALLHQHPPLY